MPLWGGGLEFVKYYYKILGIRVYRTKQIPECNNTYNLSYALAQGQIKVEITTLPNIKEKIEALCKGLDEESKNTVFRIISRSRILYKQQASFYTQLTKNELNELNKIRTEFLPNIAELDDDLYHYDGYFLPTNYFEISVFWHKHSLRDALSKQTLDSIKERDIIDAGGFIGDSAVIFEREFTNKKIYTFEPTKINYDLMLQTLKLNHSNRVIALNYGLGSKEEELEIGLSGVGASFIYNKKGKTQTAKVITLDSYVKDKNIDVGFIKVDVEGFEVEFLKGAKETIARHKPAMLISLYHQASDFFDIKPMIESWNLGYTFKIYKSIDFSLNYDTVLFCEII